MKTKEQLKSLIDENEPDKVLILLYELYKDKAFSSSEEKNKNLYWEIARELRGLSNTVAFRIAWDN